MSLFGDCFVWMVIHNFSAEVLFQIYHECVKPDLQLIITYC